MPGTAIHRRNRHSMHRHPFPPQRECCAAGDAQPKGSSLYSHHHSLQVVSSQSESSLCPSSRHISIIVRSIARCELRQRTVSESAVSTGVTLHQAIKLLKDPEPVTVTQEGNFDLLRFAESGSDDLSGFSEVSDSPALRRLVFSRPKRRREGEGTVEDSVEFGSFQLEWKGTSLIAIVAKVRWRDTVLSYADTNASSGPLRREDAQCASGTS